MCESVCECDFIECKEPLTLSDTTPVSLARSLIRSVSLPPSLCRAQRMKYAGFGRFLDTKVWVVEVLSACAVQVVAAIHKVLFSSFAHTHTPTNTRTICVCADA